MTLLEGSDNYWLPSKEGAIIVSVKTHNHHSPIWAILRGGGLHHIPSIGDEVMLSFSNGDYEGDAYLESVYMHGPPGLTAGVTVVTDKSGVEVDAPVIHLRATHGGDDQPTALMDNYFDAETTLLTSLSTFISAVSTMSAALSAWAASPIGPNLTALQAAVITTVGDASSTVSAITTFKAHTDFKTTIVKVQ